MKPSFHADAVAAALSHASPIPGTPEVILGPFYTADREAPHTLDLTGRSGEVAGAAGQHILVNIAIVDEDGHALEGVRAEFWQANALGRYRHDLDPGPVPLDPYFDGFGSQVTDPRGYLTFRTVKPGPYRTAHGETRAPHVHFQVTDGSRRLVTQMFFPGEPLNAQDRCLQGCRLPTLLIARAEPADAGPSAFSWRIVLPRRKVSPSSFDTLTESPT